MKSGLLWFDNSKKPISEKIQDAARRYQEKYGVMPDTAFINIRQYREDVKVEGIEIRSKKTIMPNHIWLGLQARETVQVRRTETYVLVGSDDEQI